AMQDALPVRVSERAGVAVNRRQPVAAFRQHRDGGGGLGRQGQRREDALGARQGTLDRLPFFAQGGDRLEEALQENQERRERSQRDIERVERLSRSGPEQRGDRQGRENGGHRRVEGRERRGAVRRGQDISEHPTKPSGGLAFTTECANDLRAPQAFLETSGERSHRDAGGALGLPEVYLQVPDDD